MSLFNRSWVSHFIHTLVIRPQNFVFAICIWNDLQRSIFYVSLSFFTSPWHTNISIWTFVCWKYTANQSPNKNKSTKVKVKSQGHWPGVIWKGIISWVCMLNMKSVSPTVQKLYLILKLTIDKQDKNNMPSIIRSGGITSVRGWCTEAMYHSIYLVLHSDTYTSHFHFRLGQE